MHVTCTYMYVHMYICMCPVTWPHYEPNIVCSNLEKNIVSHTHTNTNTHPLSPSLSHPLTNLPLKDGKDSYIPEKGEHCWTESCQPSPPITCFSQLWGGRVEIEWVRLLLNNASLHSVHNSWQANARQDVNTYKMFIHLHA